MRPIVFVLPLFVIACDSPGGGGGGGINCALTPNAPICQPDVNDTNSPDTTQPDITDPETTQPDTTQPDTTQPDTTQPDTTLPDTTPTECSGDDTRCNGTEAQVCSGGSWVTTQFCTGNTTCQNGDCVATAVCTNGTRRCTGNNVELCSNGQWMTEQNCPNGCSNNQCNSAPAGLACEDVFACIVDAGCLSTSPPSSACTSPCLNQGTTTGRNEMNALLSCYSTCNYDDACIINTCYQQRANCFFDVSGSLTCAQIDSCIGNCSSGECVVGCYEDGTNTAQGQYVRVSDCLNGYCGEDQTCWGEVISSGGPCEEGFSICFP